MIRHIWTVLCDKTIVDRDTNNVSLDVLEQLNLAPIAEANVIVPVPIVIASLWSRAELESPERARARIRIVDPLQRVIGEVTIDIDLTVNIRARTFCRFGGLLVSGPGVYEFVAEIENGSEWTEAARVPLQVFILDAATAAPLGASQTTH